MVSQPLQHNDITIIYCTSFSNLLEGIIYHTNAQNDDILKLYTSWMEVSKSRVWLDTL